MNKLTYLVAPLLLALSFAAGAGEQYVIERDVPGAGGLTSEELGDMARQSNAVLAELGPGIRWVQSYVVDDKLYCIYEAENEALIRRHAEIGGFPANRISAVKTVIDPSDGE